MAYVPVDITLEAEEGFKVWSLKGQETLSKEEKSAVMISMMGSMRDKFGSLLECVKFMTNMFVVFMPNSTSEFTRCASIQISTESFTKRDVLIGLGLEDGVATKDLPFLLPAQASPAALSDTDSRHAYACFSVVLYCIGKEITEVNQTAASTNRPGAVIGRHQLDGTDVAVLPGKPDGPTYDALSQVFASMSVYAEVRAVIIRIMVSVMENNTYYGPGMDMIITNFKLLKGAQMTHVGAIQDVLQSYPWLLKVDFLRSYISEYKEEIKKLAAVPAEFRPFVRLLGSGHDVLFPSTKLGPLVAVAIEFKKDVEKSLESYKGDWAKHRDLVLKVKALAPMFKMKEGVDNLAKALGLPDVALPDPGPNDQSDSSDEE